MLIELPQEPQLLCCLSGDGKDMGFLKSDDLGVKVGLWLLCDYSKSLTLSEPLLPPLENGKKKSIDLIGQQGRSNRT